MSENIANQLQDPKNHFTLQLTLSTLISLLLLALGCTIILYTFETQKQVTLGTTERQFDISSQQTEDKLFSIIHSVESFVEVSSKLQDLILDNSDNMEILLPYFSQSFTSLPWMSAVYVGYENGDFYMIQKTGDRRDLPRSVSVPENSTYLIKKIIQNDGGKAALSFLFYDAQLQLIWEQENVYDGYDPRTRPWYGDAIYTKQTIISEPYVFFTTQQLGYTIASSLPDNSGVVGADATLAEFSATITRQKLTPSSKIILVNTAGKIILSADDTVLEMRKEKQEQNGSYDIQVKELESKVIQQLYEKYVAVSKEGIDVVSVKGEKWFGHVRKVAGKKGDLYMIIASPFSELMAGARETRLKNSGILLALLAIAVTIGLLVSQKMAYSLKELSKQAAQIRDFQFEQLPELKSRITEVDTLAASMTVMQSAISQFVEIARALSAEKDMDRVLEMILGEMQSITGADGGAIGLVADDETTFTYVLAANSQTAMHRGGLDSQESVMADIDLQEGGTGDKIVEKQVIVSRKTINVNLADDKSGLDFSRILTLHEAKGYECKSLLFIPLLNRQNEVIGLIHLVNAREAESGEITAFSSHRIAYAEALSSNAALALDNNRLIRAQKELFDSFVKLLAGAIDTKSPYTGGHCQRVPVLATMLADQAAECNKGVFVDFSQSREERYELFVASWLHDCGKVTTPEYVVDKATKLETIYNRIHEVRTRFEVLWRDAEIDYRDQLAKHPENEKDLKQQLADRKQKLQEDFSFVATCNQGGEFMAPELMEELQRIGRQTWQRNFDDRLGLSGDEIGRLTDVAETICPVTEDLLADRPDHIIDRRDGGNPYGDNPWGFNMEVPHDLYNLGELYNLSIGRGTLTAEERYKINDHIIQTIVMLNSLPFPKDLRRVPTWAGNHHETMDGSGYPRGLTADDMSIPERIMAVADIFEALTAADRPYKQPKKLSNCIRIMSFMRKDGHICPDLFALLLTSGLYRRYAEEHMRPEQIDDVDIEQYL